MRKIHLAASLAAFFCLFIAENALFAQADRWQQKVSYKMDVKVDAENNSFSGKQRLDYWNNSPDTLHYVYFHLYQNAFLPNSYLSSIFFKNYCY